MSVVAFACFLFWRTAECQAVRRIGETLSDAEGVASADAASRCWAMKSTNTRSFGE